MFCLVRLLWVRFRDVWMMYRLFCLILLVLLCRMLFWCGLFMIVLSRKGWVFNLIFGCRWYCDVSLSF